MSTATVLSPAHVRLSLIAAMDQNGVIGADGGIPWHIPDDLRWLKKQTMNKPILMGRRVVRKEGWNISIAVAGGRFYLNYIRAQIC